VQNLAITKERKQKLVESYVGWLGQSQAVVFVRSRGLSVGEVTELRSKIREAGSQYHIVKNTLFKLALTEAGMPVPEVITGPVTVAFCAEDIAPAVKAIADFANSLRDREFEITGGIVDNEVLDGKGAEALASLPSKDTLFAQILAGMNAPASNLAGIVTSGIRQIVSVLQARVDQLQESEAAA
jgi:large subunit ribosomal protein L10